MQAQPTSNLQPEPAPRQLTLKEELFCNLYTSDVECFGNGVASYVKAYNVDLTKKGAYKSARTLASRLLSKVDILMRIQQLLEGGVLNDQVVDTQLAYLIIQQLDFGAKMAAIREYNALKARITKKIALTADDPAAEALKKLGLGEQMDAGEAQETTSETP